MVYETATFLGQQINQWSKFLFSVFLFSISLILGFFLLVVSADRLVLGASSIAKNLGVSPLVIGLTIVGLGTSAPEIFVSTMAAIEGNQGIAMGNAIGSNIANLGLILGFTALIKAISVHSGVLKRELPILLGASFLVYLLALFGYHGKLSGTIMLVGAAAFTLWLIKSLSSTESEDILTAELTEELPQPIALNLAWTWFIIGLITLLLSSRLLIWSAVNIAQYFGLSDLIIGLTIIALGTSLPELAASITSVLKQEDDLAVGNVIGSNMYNLLIVYAIPGIISPGSLDPSLVSRDFPVMLGFTLVVFYFASGFLQSGKISRFEGGLLLSAYLLYGWLVLQN